MRPKMKTIKFKFLIAIVFLTLCSCGVGRGTLTIVNATLEAANIGIDGKNIVVAPAQHFTQKGLKAGPHQVKIGAKPPLAAGIGKQKTTIVDIGGDNCFVVADYADQYGEKGTGMVKVIEKFSKQKAFTTTVSITADLGEELPQKVHGQKMVTRIHRVDCSWMDNDQAIIDAIANLP